MEQGAKSIEPKSMKENKTDFTNETQQNFAKVVEYLSTDVLNPTTVDELIAALNITRNKIVWTLHNLKICGWAEQIADGWRLGPRLPRIADKVKKGITDEVKRYLGEVKG